MKVNIRILMIMLLE